MNDQNDEDNNEDDQDDNDNHDNGHEPEPTHDDDEDVNNNASQDDNGCATNDAGNNVNDSEMEARYGPQTGAYGLCPRKPRDYLHHCSHTHAMYDAMEHPVNETVLTQYNVNKGLKVFGQVGADGEWWTWHSCSMCRSHWAGATYMIIKHEYQICNDEHMDIYHFM